LLPALFHSLGVVSAGLAWPRPASVRPPLTLAMEASSFARPHEYFMASIDPMLSSRRQATTRSTPQTRDSRPLRNDLSGVRDCRPAGRKHRPRQQSHDRFRIGVKDDIGLFQLNVLQSASRVNHVYSTFIYYVAKCASTSRQTHSQVHRHQIKP
jgi:hypothetical protein